ncbi:MAG: trypsin-like peptidase domain-containing protein [Acutalibacteraceae bacterium]|nr:trypsin-like peptidase domain-containing protein [Acutalibacteraceae bacterium]
MNNNNNNNINNGFNEENNFNDRYNNSMENENPQNTYGNNIYSNSYGNSYSSEQSGSSSESDVYNPYTSDYNAMGNSQSYHSDSEYSYVYKNGTPQSTSAQSNVYSNSKPKEKRKGKGHFMAKVIAAAICFGIVAGSVMVGVNYAGNNLLSGGSSNNSASSIKSTSSVKTTSGESVNTTYDVASVVENLMPSMVSINIKATATAENPYSQYFNFGYGYGGNDTYEYETEGSGSGIIISESNSELLIVTNNHVVDGATEINVTFVNDETCSASIKGTDPDYDLAVIAVKLSDIPEETKKEIAIATLGDSETLQLGQPAIAIGNALGYGQSVTVGYISALEREVQMTDNTMTLIQTDAAINPGNSGGALIDMNGNVIGINSAKYSDTDVEGMGYAIPISDAQPIIEDLINQTNISENQQAYLGITGTDVTESYTQAFGLPTGVYVSQVNENSPASNAGIQAGDIITKFDGRDVSTMEGLQSKIKSKKSGEKVEIILQRQQRNGGYKEVSVTVTLGSKSDAPQNN